MTKKRTFRVIVELTASLEIEVEANTASEARKLVRKQQEANQLDLKQFDIVAVAPQKWFTEEVLEEGVSSETFELEDNYLDDSEHNLSDIEDSDSALDLD